MYALQYTRARYDALKQKNDWVQIVVYVLLSISVISTLAISAFCIAKGGNLEWSYKFGIWIKIACKFNR